MTLMVLFVLLFLAGFLLAELGARLDNIIVSWTLPFAGCFFTGLMAAAEEFSFVWFALPFSALIWTIAALLADARQVARPSILRFFF
ncbi:MAG TPA: hypothetical protein VEA59_06905 [Patescibacteria group bacterium]|nr:hypothetical protein [Patescibacteria group bacterium]